MDELKIYRTLLSKYSGFTQKEDQFLITPRMLKEMITEESDKIIEIIKPHNLKKQIK